MQNKIETVAEFFQRKLGEPLEHPDHPHCPPDHPASPAHPEFTVETGCGEPCAAAIEAYARVLGAWEAPARVGRCNRAALVQLAREQVMEYVFG